VPGKKERLVSNFSARIARQVDKPWRTATTAVPAREKDRVMTPPGQRFREMDCERGFACTTGGEIPNAHHG
jgi:hypothetical protein